MLSASAKDFLTRKQAAAHLSALGYPVSVRTLERLADAGRGPPFIRFMQKLVRYEPAALERWAKTQTTRFDGDTE